MQKIMRYLSMAALAVVGAVMSSCTNDDLTAEASQPQTNNTVTLTTTISLDGGAQTRALTSAGVKTFAKGDQIAVIYKNTEGKVVKAVSNALTDKDISADELSREKKKATFTVALTKPAPNGDLRYIYPAAMATDCSSVEKTNDDKTVNYDALSYQDGTLTSLAKNLDLAIFDGKLTADAKLPSYTATSPVKLTNHLTIGEFTIKNGSSDITSTIINLSISDGTNSYIVNRTAGAGPIYVAMKPISNKTVTVNATAEASDDLNYYSKEVTGATLQNNYIYPINVTTNKIDPPLTLEFIQNGEISFKNKAAGPVTYRINGLADPAYKIASGDTKKISVNVGDKVTFYGDNPRYDLGHGDWGTNSLIGCDGECYIYGNIMSLISSMGYATATELTGEYTFCHLFTENYNIKNHSSKELKLPATTLAEDCYQCMFSNCKNLTRAPELPAGKDGKGLLASWCYDSMFAGCDGLTVAPDLPAMKLERSCYQNMFSGCSNLTTAVLPANKLVNACYTYMFCNCKKLSSVTCLATDISADGCLDNWLKNAGADISEDKMLYVTSGINISSAKWNVPEGWRVIYNK